MLLLGTQYTSTAPYIAKFNPHAQESGGGGEGGLKMMPRKLFTKLSRLVEPKPVYVPIKQLAIAKTR